MDEFFVKTRKIVPNSLFGKTFYNQKTPNF